MKQEVVIQYRTKYDAHGRPEGEFPVRVYPVGSSKALSDKVQAVIALLMLAVACGGFAAILAFGQTIKALF